MLTVMNIVMNPNPQYEEVNVKCTPTLKTMIRNDWLVLHTVEKKEERDRQSLLHKRDVKINESKVVWIWQLSQTGALLSFT